MNAWSRVPFSDLLVESRDGEWGEGHEVIGHQLCEVIRGTDFAGLNDTTCELPQRWLPDHLVERKKLIAGDIVFEMAGGTAKQSTGRSALLKHAFFQRHQEHPVLCASFCRHLRLDQKQYRPEFVYYLLQALYAAGYMSVFNIQHTGVSRFQYTSFKKQTVLDIPSLETQKKIAAILSAYDDLIENNRRRIALLEKMAEEIYREWFVRMRFPGHDQAKFEKGVPVGWRQAELGEIAEINSHSLKRGSEPEWIEYLDISAVSTNAMATPNKVKFMSAPGRARRLVSHGDVIWSSVRPGNRAYCLVLNPPESLVASTGFAVISPKRNVPYSFVHKAVTTDSFVEEMVAVAKGAAYPATSFEDFAKAKLLLPDASLLRRFHEVSEPLLLQADKLRKQMPVLIGLRDALLPRLISGKLPVEALDIRFPSSMETSAHEV